jgi:hygromycin-B 7''-O-kinase
MKIPKITTNEDFVRHYKDEFWIDAAKTICRRHRLPFEQITRAEYSENIVFLIDKSFVIKIHTPFRAGFEREKKAMLFAENKTSLPVPKILFADAVEQFEYFIFTQSEGVLMTRAEWLKLKTSEQTDVISELAVGLKELHSHDASAIDFDWKKFVEYQAETTFERQKRNGASADWLEKLPRYIEENLPLLPLNASSFVHGDVHFGNLRLKQTNGKWEISGIFDFADSLKGSHEYEFVAIGVLMIQGQKEIQREFFRAYGYAENELDETLRRRLMLLTCFYECSDLRKYALRLRPEAVDYTLEELEKAIWNFVTDN